jgi:phosphoglycolate phosphatase
MTMDLDLRGTAVLFDKDGTLFDFTASWAAASAEILRQLAQGDTERLSTMARAGGFDLATQTFREDSIIIAGTVAEVADVLARAGALPRTRVQAVTEAVVATAQMAPVAGLRPALETLRAAGARLGVVTNDSEQAAIVHLNANGLTDLFDAVVGYDSGYAPKPAPGSCLGAAARISIAPDQCIMVGDSTHDLEAGAAAGMTCLAVLTGIAGASVLAPRAAAVLPSVAQVPIWLAQNGRSRKTTANVAFDT